MSFATANALSPPVLLANSQHATKVLLEFIVDSLWPTTLGMKSKMSVLDEQTVESRSVLVNLRSVFTLCCSQIHKCVLHLIEIFQLEHRNNILMQESRDCTLERLTWCLSRLQLVQNTIDKMSVKTHKDTEKLAGDILAKASENVNEIDDSHDSSILTTPMYFVNWIDQSLEILTNLSATVYRTDYEESAELFDTWNNEVIDGVSGLHMSVDELLLSAMTLCRYCLPADQPILTTRCQVVLRETKHLISEIIEGDVDKVYKVTKNSLKLPLKPTNINVLIDVLKDALYVLETNTNTALLALLVHCFSTPIMPLDNLVGHFMKGSKGACPCDIEDVEDCPFVKEFDFYNERLIHVGGFSISCSSDENRVLSLKSGLASLEALDPHLVPAVLVAPRAPHATFLAAAWRREVLQIRASIFLIVDPAAFSERAKGTMNKRLVDLIKGNAYVNGDVCAVINLGQIVCDFFSTYKTLEPEALAQYVRLELLLVDLHKVLKECKTVSNLSSTTPEDFLYDIPQTSKMVKNITFEQLLKRLKLLFTIVNRINGLFHTNDGNGGNIFDDEDCDATSISRPVNATHTINKESQAIVVENRASIKQFGRYANSPSKNVFARDASINPYDPSRCIISKITKHLSSTRVQEELSFSVQLDELFNDLSQYKGTKNSKQEDSSSSYIGNGKSFAVNKNFTKVQNTSILYNAPLGSNRESLRKIVLRKKYMNPTEDGLMPCQLPSGPDAGGNVDLQTSMDVMDSTTNLQITEILGQLSNFSRIITSGPLEEHQKTVINISTGSTFDVKSASNHTDNGNILTLCVNENVDNDNVEIAKNVWTIPVNSSLDDTRPSEFSISSSTQSNVTTLERLSDIDLLEDRLNKLKSSNV